MDDEFIVLITVECDLILGLDPGQRKDIGNTVWVKPYCAISWKPIYQVGSGHPGCTMDVHVFANPPTISEESTIDENINSGLVVQKDPFQWETSPMSSLNMGLVMDNVNLIENPAGCDVAVRVIL